MPTRLLVLLVCLVGNVVSVAAQQPGTAAMLRGRVLDPQHQGVAARVRVIQVSTGLERDVESDSAGHFVVPNIPPGEIDVAVSAVGFAGQRLQGIRLEVGRAAEIDIMLQVAEVSEHIAVAGNAGTVDVLGSSVGAVVSAREIEALPLNGRNFLELAFLTPGNAPAPNFDPTKAQSIVISSGGQAGRGGNVMIDGMDNNDDAVGGPLMNISQDAVQEFQVVTGRFSAEFGRSAGSVINVVTRSGGDALHGSASLFLRDGQWQATPEILDRNEVGDPPFDRQQMAFTAGGPLYRQRFFGFGGLEIRNQDGGVLVGVRDPIARAIRRGYASAPLDDLLGTFRADWRAASADDVMVRYSIQREDAVAASALERAIGAASQRQQSRSRFHAFLGSWTRVLSSRAVNTSSLSLSRFDNRIAPVEPGVQLTFPTIQAGSSFRIPQGTAQQRWQLANAFTLVQGPHQWKFGGQVQRVDAQFDLGVFRDGRVELVEDFPAFDRNGDGRVDDDDLLFAVALRSGRPDRDLSIPNADSVHLAAYVQDEWRVNPRVSLSLGVRYEVDTDVNNVSRVGELNPLLTPFLTEPRRRDTNNWAPRIGVNWSSADARTSVRGGYGLYYDRVTLEIQSLERGLDGRALPIVVRAGNLLFLDPVSGRVPPFAPSVSSPYTAFVLPGAGASGINVIDARLQNPKVHQLSLGIERQLGSAQVIRMDVVHNHGTDFIIGRTVGTVFNPVVGGPDRVVNLESSVETDYDALLVELERRLSGRLGVRVAYTLSKAFNYANDDQIPFSNGPIDPADLRREYGPAPNDQRHRLVMSGSLDLGARFQVAGLWTLASGVPMDVLMPDGRSRIPVLQRNAGGRVFRTAKQLNEFIRDVNGRGGIDGELLPAVSDDARFNDTFNSLDIRVSRSFAAGPLRVAAYAELFNVFDVTNVLGASTANYSGFANALARDSNDPAQPGYLRSSTFGLPVRTAGGVFGSGGPFALQVGARVDF